MVSLIQKKKFLKWFLMNKKLKSREGIWIINYMLSKNDFLERVHFVESVTHAPTGLMLSSIEVHNTSFSFNSGTKTSINPDMSFMELRKNTGEPIYLDLQFKDRYSNELFLSVLEEATFHSPEHTNVSRKEIQNIDSFLGEFVVSNKIHSLEKEINIALEQGDKDKFLVLTEEYNQIMSM